MVLRGKWVPQKVSVIVVDFGPPEAQAGGCMRAYHDQPQICLEQIQ